MEPLFKTILCPIDFDRVSLPAVEMVKKIAGRGEIKIYLMYVIPQATRREKPSADETRVANDEMKSIAKKWFEGNAATEIVVREGDPAAEIIHAAKEFKADLIVMATHGRTGVDHMLLGSVAERVVREARRPVLTVHPAPAKK
ncbi:MAG TPA: universal stress protein [Candidatus Binataceae bacterium]|nr:universal stress protein [Candidatus Binataceae bacterium]